MRYISTRGQAPVRDFAGVLLAGLAEDGGLYVPEAWPRLSPADLRGLRGLPYHELAARVLAPFVGSSIPFATLQAMCQEAYAGFGHPAVVPLVQLDACLWAQELFHGPTLAFKDVAMQLLGRMFAHVLAQQNQRVTIVGATSGDTGSAAIEACRDRPGIDVVILHPQGRTSEVQRRQMTTVDARNIANIAVDGTFDDCQDLVKAMFADEPFRRDLHLSAVNSINWARIAAQIPYYVAAALALGAPEREVAFSVPTGNFGNVLAAWAARRMGVPIARLVVASNRNDILARFLENNDMSIQGVEPSLSPSMDIQVSSNFERLLFELLDRDPRRDRGHHAGFPQHRSHGRAKRRLDSRPHTVPRLPAGRLGDGGRNPPAIRAGLPRGPAHRDRHRRRPGTAVLAHPHRGRRHRAPGQVPGRHRARDRPAPGAAAAACRLVRPHRDIQHGAQQPRRRRGAGPRLQP